MYIFNMHVSTPLDLLFYKLTHTNINIYFYSRCCFSQFLLYARIYVYFDDCARLYMCYILSYDDADDRGTPSPFYISGFYEYNLCVCEWFIHISLRSMLLLLLFFFRIQSFVGTVYWILKLF